MHTSGSKLGESEIATVATNIPGKMIPLFEDRKGSDLLGFN